MEQMMLLNSSEAKVLQDGIAILRSDLLTYILTYGNTYFTLNKC